MEFIDKDVSKFIEFLKSKEKMLDEETLKNVAYNIIFFKYYGNSLSNTHYLNSLIQDALAIIDSLSQKSERYYHFILRSYVENFMRVLLALENEDSMGVMKLFKNSKKLLDKYTGASVIFEQFEKQYDECCLFVHSNIKANIEISVFLKMIIERNDFGENLKVNSSLKKFESILSNSIKLLLICRSETIDNSFYRNKDILKKLITEENYTIFTSSLNN